MTDAIPSADDFFSPQKPSSDDFLGSSQSSPQPMSGAAQDSFWSFGTAGHILNAFGVGAKDGWGASNVGISDDFATQMRKAGLFNDWQKGEQNFYKGVNEGVIRGIAAGGDLFMRSFPAVFGAAEQAAATTGQELEKTGVGQDINAGQLGQDVAGMIEWGAQRGDINLARSAGVAQAAKISASRQAYYANLATQEAKASAARMEKARSVGAIGESDASYSGIAPVSDADRAARSEATENYEALTATERGAEPISAEVPTAANEPLSLDTAARNIDPDTFSKYDALDRDREQYRSQLNDLGSARESSPEAQQYQDTIDSILNKVGGVEDRLTNKQSDRIEEARNALEDVVSSDTPEMADIRQKLMQADYQMRDMSPKVADAYRQAHEYMPATEEEIAAQSGTPENVPLSAPEAIQQETTPTNAKITTTNKPKNTISNIREDVTRRLTNAGRSTEEAKASAEIINAHYEARAARFNGKKGSSLDLYNQEHATVVAGKGNKGGNIQFKNGRTIIRLLDKADASTFIHETGHQWLEEIMRDAKDAQAPADLFNDVKAIRSWLKVEDGAELTRAQHEKFARGFERYVMEGVAPSTKLVAVFEKFKNWLIDIYKRVSALKSPINDDIRGVFDRLFTHGEEKPIISAEERKTPQEGKGAGTIRPVEPQPRKSPSEQPAAAQVAATRAPEQGEQPMAPEVSAKPVVDNGANPNQPGGKPFSEQQKGTSPPKAGEMPKSSAQPFGDTPKFVDKAGNIRLDILGDAIAASRDPDGILDVIRQVSDENRGFITSRRGVISDGDVLELADSLGMTPEQLSKRKLGDAFNAEQILAANKILIQSATDVRDAMKDVANGGDAALAKYAQIRARHVLLQNQVAGITAEAGRALHSFQVIRQLSGVSDVKFLENFLHDENLTFNQLKEEAKRGAALETPQQISKFMQDAQNPRFMDYVTEFWINAILCGPRTHITNIVGNALTDIVDLIDYTGAATIGSGREALGFATEADHVQWGEVQGRLFGLFQGATEGIRAAKRIVANGGVDEISKIDLPRRKVIPGLAGNIVRTPGTFLTAEDAFFKAIGYRQELNAEAYRIANSEGLSGDKLAQRISDIVSNPTEDMILKATSNAEYLTYQTKLGKMGSAISGFANSYPLLRFIIPFIRTPTNILKFAIQHSAASPFMEEARANMIGTNGAISRDIQASRLAVGSAISALSVYYCLKGYVTGGGPSDPKQRALLYMTGWQPYSFKIGDAYYSYQRIDPFSTLLGVAADGAEISTAMNGQEQKGIADMIFASITKNLTNKTWLQGVSDAIEAISDPDRYGKNYINSMVASFVPAVVAQTAQSLDPEMRDARNIVDSVKTRVPGLSQQVLPRRDIWGNSIEHSGAFGGPVSPIYESQVTNDPIVQKMLDAGYFPSKLQRKIRGVQLSEQQYDEYQQIAGVVSHERCNEIISAPYFEQMPKELQFKAIQSIIESSRSLARSSIMMKYPGIIQQVMDNKLRGIKE